MKKRIIILVSSMSILSLNTINTYNAYTENLALEEQIQRQKNRKEFNNIKKEIENKIAMDKQIKEKKKEIANFLASEEYQEREEKRKRKEQFEEQYNLDIESIKKMEFEVSYYSDLACENSIYGNITSRGEILSEGMIANNTYEYDTKIYLEGLGMKYIADRGSKKYFNNDYKLDVFVPREKNETDEEYYKRVNNLGRHKVVGYVIEEN